MRIIEPKQPKPAKRSNKKFRITYFVLLLLIGSVITKIYILPKNQTADFQAPQSGTEQIPNDTLAAVDNKDFQRIYPRLAYPNTEFLVHPPNITGSIEADNRIRALALARGYRQMATPVSPIVKIKGDNLLGELLLQPLAAEAWYNLSAAAKQAGMPLVITSTYRSIEDQRDLFLSRLAVVGATTALIKSGSADTAINTVLDQAAPPGYSRHHTGYTIDLACDTIGLHAFLATRCYKWLSANNFALSREYGWIPSYPEGDLAQGPEPEPWEFVWLELETRN